MGEEGRTILVFDLQELPFQYDKLREACEEWGCFRVVNHGVPASLMTEMKRIARSLLDLPIETKHRNTAVTPRGGYLPLGKKNSILESLCISELTSPEIVSTFCSVLDATPQHREVIEMYSGAVSALSMDVAEKLAKSLGLSGGKDQFPGWTCRLRMNKYNFSPETVGDYGVNTHTDASFLSFLQEDDAVGGLEILNKSGSFIAVKPRPGTFFVNVGDFGVAWSNGKFIGGKHRVHCIEGQVRISIATFMMMPYGVALEPPEELINSQNPRLYAPFSFEDYIKLIDDTEIKTGEVLSLLRNQF